MSPLPDRMRNRWLDRAERTPNSGVVYWHILMNPYPQAREAAADIQESLSDFPGLHMTPLKWLHITTLIAGSTDEITRTQMSAMVSDAQRLLRDVPPVPVTLGRVFYHPEAIALPIHPVNALRPIFNAAQSATVKAVGYAVVANDASLSWRPHMTIAYSTVDQPVAPIVSALGMRMTERQVIIDSLTLVIQWGPERLWNWEPTGTARLHPL